MRNVCRVLVGLACTLLLLGVTLPGQATDAPDRSWAAPGPLMGWSGYNFAGPHVTEALVKRNAELMVLAGLAAAGYRYVLLDGGWNLLARDRGGNLRADPAKFPHGMPWLVRFVHGLGLKFGLYLSAGVTNCAGHSAGSWGHYARDAALLASWGVDAIKLDYCEVPVPLAPPNAAAIARQMAQAVAATDRPMVLDANVANARRNHALSWTWAAQAGASEWRVSADIRPGYTSMVRQIFGTGLPAGQSYDAKLWRFASPGHFNDPDYLEVGNGQMTLATDQAQIALWAEEAAPLVISTNLATVSPAVLSLLENPEVIAIDQDPRAAQGRLADTAGGCDLLVKPMSDGSAAVLAFNLTLAPATVRFTATQAGLPAVASYTVRDVLAHTSQSNRSRHFTLTTPAHGVAMVRITPSHTRRMR